MNLTRLSKRAGPLFFPTPFPSSRAGFIHESQMTNLGLFPAILIFGFKASVSLYRYKSKDTHTHTEPRVWCSDLVLTLCRFVCQLNNGLAWIKASHNYTPAVINPMCINVIVVGAASSVSAFSVTWSVGALFPRNSQKHLQKHSHRES